MEKYDKDEWMYEKYEWNLSLFKRWSDLFLKKIAIYNSNDCFKVEKQ